MILACTKVRVRLLINVTTTFFAALGMSINAAKCFSLRTDVTVKTRAPVTINSPTYHINNQPIAATNYDSTFKYLGVTFNPCGEMNTNIHNFQQLLDRLLQSPLKPYQKLHLLTTYLLPRLNHRLVLGRITKGLLTLFDRLVRASLKKLLHLPNDTPDGFFYSSVKDGGLGVPIFEQTIPRLTLRRIDKLQQSSDPVVAQLLTTSTMQKLWQQSVAILQYQRIEDAVRHNICDAQRLRLVSTIDDKPLAECRKNPGGQLWLTGKTNIISGRTFIHLVKLRIGRLEKTENCNRGRDMDKKCRHCHRVNESLVHILQCCHVTHFPRMARHDAIARIIYDKCMSSGFFSGKKLKPDLVIIKPDATLVIDVSVVTAGMRFRHMAVEVSLSATWEYKAKYYRDDELIEQLRQQFRCPEVWFNAVILSARGLWCRRNDETLEKCEIPKNVANTIVIRSMEHSVKIWQTLMRITR